VGIIPLGENIDIPGRRQARDQNANIHPERIELHHATENEPYEQSGRVTGHTEALTFRNVDDNVFYHSLELARLKKVLGALAQDSHYRQRVKPQWALTERNFSFEEVTGSGRRRELGALGASETRKLFDSVVLNWFEELKAEGAPVMINRNRVA